MKHETLHKKGKKKRQNLMGYLAFEERTRRERKIVRYNCINTLGASTQATTEAKKMQIHTTCDQHQ